MRLLDAAKVTYSVRTYDFDESDLSGVHAADALGMPPETVFKTLVARGDKTGFVVFCIPVAEELDLKKAAKVSGNKAVEMLHVKELLPTTGYIRGGCSPIGMKKPFTTVFDQSAASLQIFFVSAGRVGRQIETSPKAIAELIGAKFEHITV